MLEDDRVGTIFFLFLLGGEHIYRYCKFFRIIVSMPSAQLSLSSKDFFFLSCETMTSTGGSTTSIPSLPLLAFHLRSQT